MAHSHGFSVDQGPQAPGDENPASEKLNMATQVLGGLAINGVAQATSLPPENIPIAETATIPASDLDMALKEIRSLFLELSKLALAHSTTCEMYILYFNALDSYDEEIDDDAMVAREIEETMQDDSVIEKAVKHFEEIALSYKKQGSLEAFYDDIDRRYPAAPAGRPRGVIQADGSYKRYPLAPAEKYGALIQAIKKIRQEAPAKLEFLVQKLQKAWESYKTLKKHPATIRQPAQQEREIPATTFFGLSQSNGIVGKPLFQPVSMMPAPARMASEISFTIAPQNSLSAGLEAEQAMQNSAAFSQVTGHVAPISVPQDSWSAEFLAQQVATQVDQVSSLDEEFYRLYGHNGFAEEQDSDDKPQERVSLNQSAVQLPTMGLFSSSSIPVGRSTSLNNAGMRDGFIDHANQLHQSIASLTGSECGTQGLLQHVFLRSRL